MERGDRHLPALDVVRAATVAAVISVHSVSVLLPSRPGVGGVVLSVAHSSRYVFLALSAMVLSRSAGDRPVAATTSWRRRVPLVVAPYAAWSAAYFAAGGAPGGLRHLATDLLDGGAQYHLYFLLLTLQLYAVLPWLLPWLRRVRHPWRFLGTSASIELAFTGVVHWRLPMPPPLAWLTAHPGTWLPSYQFPVLAGLLAGQHAPAVVAWCTERARLLGATVAATTILGVGCYLLAVKGGVTPLQASEVWQPTAVVEAASLAAFEVGIGQRVLAAAGASCSRRLAQAADLSFGVYLVHPLLLQLLVRDGWATVLARLPPVASVVATLLVVVPLVAVTSAVGAAAARRTRFSLVATGRRPLPRARRAGAALVAGPPQG